MSYETTRVSKSKLFEFHKEVYSDSNINNFWNQDIETFFWTNNCFIALYYAKIIKKIIQTENSVNIVELGAGQGRFSYFLLRNLEVLLSKDELLKIKYIMTDISKKRVEYWVNHPKFETYKNLGILDFSIFDMANPKEHLLSSGKKLIDSLEDENNIIISNYMLSDLSFDLFKVKSNKLYECLLKVDEKLNNIEISDYLKVANELDISFILKNTNLDYYKNKNINKILEYYLDKLEEGTFDIPIDLIKSFDFFKKFSKKLFWIITDEANFHTNNFINKNPHINRIFSGLLSNKVNLDAFSKYTNNFSFELLAKEFPDVWFDTYFLTPKKYILEVEFKGIIDSFNTNDFLHIFDGMIQKNISSRALLSFIKLSNYDPYIIRMFDEKIIAIANGKNSYNKEHLKEYLKKCWDNYYEIDEEFDMGKCIGNIFKALGLQKEAMECFEYKSK